jgi:hypothetical protein
MPIMSIGMLPLFMLIMLTRITSRSSPTKGLL